MRSILLYTASVLISSVAVWASSVTITEPEPNQVWEAGSTVHIKWTVNDHKAAKKIRLQYASGPSQALIINGLIADHVNGTSGSYKWKIPKDLKPKKYVIEAGPSAKDLAYAGYITIKKGHGTKVASKETKHHTTHKKKMHVSKKKSSSVSNSQKSKKHTTRTKKHAPIKKKHSTTLSKKKHHVTSKSKHSTIKPSAKPAHEDVYRSSAVCIGYPTRGEGTSVSDEYVRCHSLPKQDSFYEASAGKASNKNKKKSKTTKKNKTTRKSKTTKKQ